RARCSPRTQRTASETFDLPQPFGPTIAVTPGSKARPVLSAKDLKPWSSSFVSRTSSLSRYDRRGLVEFRRPEWHRRTTLPARASRTRPHTTVPIRRPDAVHIQVVRGRRSISAGRRPHPPRRSPRETRKGHARPRQGPRAPHSALAARRGASLLARGWRTRPRARGTRVLPARSPVQTSPPEATDLRSGTRESLQPVCSSSWLQRRTPLRRRSPRDWPVRAVRPRRLLHSLPNRGARWNRA